MPEPGAEGPTDPEALADRQEPAQGARDPFEGHRPQQIPGMARLLELTPELYDHYA